MKIDFTGQVCLVTGASRGIGNQIAKDLAALGAKIIAASTRASDGPRLRDELGAETEHFAVDFSDAGQCREFYAHVRSLPRLDVCVNNAGLSRHGSVASLEESDWDVTQDVDLKAPVFLSQAAAAPMKRRGYGRIVNIASIWAHVTGPDRAAYTAAKFGLRGVTMSLAIELAPDNILVNVVAPGFTLTDMVKNNYSEEKQRAVAEKIPLGRLAETAEISSAVLYLASSANTYITGQSLVADGGYCIV